MSDQEQRIAELERRVAELETIVQAAVLNVAYPLYTVEVGSHGHGFTNLDGSFRSVALVMKPEGATENERP